MWHRHTRIPTRRFLSKISLESKSHATASDFLTFELLNFKLLHCPFNHPLRRPISRRTLAPPSPLPRGTSPPELSNHPPAAPRARNSPLTPARSFESRPAPVAFFPAAPRAIFPPRTILLLGPSLRSR